MGHQEIEQTFEAGDVLHTPPYVWRWHGATQQDPLVHIARFNVSSPVTNMTKPSGHDLDR